MAVKNPDNAGNQRWEGKLWCVYSHRINHTRENCWKLHGRPPNWRTIGNPKEFHKLQIEQLLKLLNQSQNTSSNIPSCTIAQKGTFVNALNAKSCHPWIIDPGAIDHMTGNSSLFATYSPRPGNFKVKIADGS